MSTQADFPTPWKRIDAAYRRRCQGLMNGQNPVEMPEVQVRWGRPVYKAAEGRVLAGVVRKAGAAMMRTCIACGRPGKLRRAEDERAVLCPRCFAEERLPQEIRTLLEDIQEPGPPPDNFARSVWHQHDLSSRLVAVIPSHCWRHTKPPDGKDLRYLTRSDILALKDWLVALADIAEVAYLEREATA